jgi:CheY-like chemotaxis protein
MPVMSGLDAARVLKRMMHWVPLIMFSEYADAFSEQEAPSAGISALELLTKPHPRGHEGHSIS